MIIDFRATSVWIYYMNGKLRTPSQDRSSYPHFTNILGSEEISGFTGLSNTGKPELEGHFFPLLNLEKSFISRILFQLRPQDQMGNKLRQTA